MRIIYQFSTLILFVLCSVSAYGQLEVTNAAPITPENLITNVFLGDGVEVINVTFQGDGDAVGFFNHGENAVGIERGIVLTTGAAVTNGADTGVNSTGGTQAAEGTTSNVFDQDLADLADNNDLNDVCKYTITFVPTSDTLRFSYAFGSEEYPEYACSGFNDIFGFFISGPGINGAFSNGGENIALIPGTDLPVRINNVNPGVVGANGTLANCTPPDGSLAFSEFYNDNNGSNMMPVYDGFTDVFIAEAVVMPCSTYTIKLLIADANDQSHDSGVFLEAKSFGTGSLDVEIVGLALDGGLSEGCADGTIVFSLPNPVEDTYEVEFDVSGTATPDVDYPALPSSVFINPGDSVVTIPLSAYEDNIDEGDETIILSVQRDPCNRDTFTLVIKDNQIIKPDLGNDLVQCETESVQLDGTIPIVLPEPPTFVNDSPLQINQTNVPFSSEIDVFGVLPTVLGPEAIKMICIDSLEHRWIDDLDIFIIAPDGQFMELSTDNGGNGGNGLGMDNFINTCFTLDASTVISFPGPLAPPEAVPFTGEWQPEGVWSDLWDGGDKTTNGTWTLLITDDTQSLDGTLFSWRICFNPVYQVEYSWTPAAGLSCTDCPDPVASPDVTTTYILDVVDSYGCMASDTITIEVLDALDMTNLVCNQASTSSVSVIWDAVVGATGYEVSINGGPWITPTGTLEHQQTGLGLVETVEISVRANGICPGLPMTIECTSLDCTPAELGIQTTNASCFGVADGTATVEIISGTPPFSYDLGGEVNDTGIFADLLAGAHPVMVSDGDGCIGTVIANITQPPSPTFEPVIVDSVSCFGGSDGALTVNIIDGNGPYTFDWGAGLTDSILTSQSMGTHQVQLADINDCPFTVDVQIGEPTELTATIEGADVSCNGQPEGTAFVTPEGGTMPYSYMWTDGQMLDTAFALVANDYQVLVTDANDCQVNQMITIDEPAALVLMTDSDPVLCDGDSNGSVMVDIQGGVENYAIVWTNLDNGMVVGDEASISSLPAGNYEALVVDANDCQESLQVVIDTPTELELQNLQTTDPSCFGAADGTGTIEAIGGTEPYTFTWNSTDDGSAINTLEEGDHTVEVMDDNGCSVSLNFNLTAPMALALSTSTELVSCFDGSDGTASVDIVGGTAPFTYSWEDGQDTPTAIDLPAGMISVTVTDDNDCEAEIVAEVSQPTLLELTIDGTDPLCNGAADGNATVTPSGGTGPYDVEWDNGQQTATASSLAVGSHTVSVTDSEGCLTEISITLGEPQALSASMTVEEQGCTGPPDGEAAVLPTGGTMPYSYEWHDGQITATATQLVTGTAAVTVTDAQGCTFEIQDEVPQAQSVVITDHQFVDVSCNSGADGNINIVAENGELPYTFTWSDASIGNTGNPTTLQEGTYTVTVTDNNLCTDMLTVTIGEPSVLQLSSILTNVVCAGETTGAVDLTVTGGTAPYVYNWSNGAQGEDIENLGAGDYNVFVTDAQGCIESLDNVINEAPELVLSANVLDVDCYGNATGNIKTAVSGGQSPYTFIWNDGSVEMERLNITFGNYELTVTDDYGCTLVQSFEVTQPDEVSMSLSAMDVSCNGGRDGLVQVEVSGGSPPFRYKINNEPYGGSSTFVGLAAGSYNVSVIDGEDCEYFAGSISIAEPDPIIVDLGSDIRLFFGESATVTPAVTGSLPIVQYTWSPYDTAWMSCEHCEIIDVFPLGQRDLFLEVIDENGCIGEDWIRFIVEKNFPVMVPTGFSPNGDQVNDLLMVHGLPGVEILSFQIFDRWGEQVFFLEDFDVNDASLGWDGSFRNQPMNGGVFVWKLDALLLDGTTKQFTGQTTLIR